MTRTTTEWGQITTAQADAIVSQLVNWLPNQRSLIAAIICDAVSADITLQPLHDAYVKRRQDIKERV